MNTKTLRYWLVKGIGSTLDQGFFALSNFFVNLLLARWMTSQEYGEFVVAYTGLLLVGCIHSALLIEPILIFGNGRYQNDLSAYLRALLKCHWILTASVSALLAIAGISCWYLGNEALALWLILLSLISPMVFFQWIMRRICYVNLEAYYAGYAGKLYLVLALLGIVVAQETEWLSGVVALGILGGASLISGIWLNTRLKIGRTLEEETVSTNVVAHDHWDYGKWVLGTSFFSWGFGNIYFLILPLFYELEVVGAFKVLHILIVPMMHVITAVGRVLISAFVRARNKFEFDKIAWTALSSLVAGSLVYWLFLGQWNHEIINWMFRGKYDEYSDLFWIVGIVPVFFSCSVVFGAVHQALEQPDRQFLCYLQTGVFSLIFTLVLTAFWGILGATLGMVFSYGFVSLYLWRSYSRSSGSINEVTLNEV